ncbi:MAG TPA: hypothetical protein EYO59_10670 [Chromatiaceae bacterium]|nr:hypothetical protein [Chromatiaceae bacterium]
MGSMEVEGESQFDSSQVHFEIFMSQTLRILLQILHGRFSDLSLIRAFTASKIILKQFGARLFLLSVGDTMQDWLRRTVFHGSSHSLLLREAASQFLLYLIRCVYHYTGTLCDVERPLLSIFSEVVVNRVEGARSRKVVGGRAEMTVNEVERVVNPARAMINYMMTLSSPPVGTYTSLASSTKRLLNKLYELSGGVVILFSHIPFRCPFTFSGFKLTYPFCLMILLEERAGLFAHNSPKSHQKNEITSKLRQLRLGLCLPR